MKTQKILQGNRVGKRPALLPRQTELLQPLSRAWEVLEKIAVHFEKQKKGEGGQARPSLAMPVSVPFPNRPKPFQTFFQT